MKKNTFFARKVLLSSLIVLSMQVQANSVPKDIKIQRSFVNLGFETVPDLSDRKMSQYGCTLDDGDWKTSYCVFAQNAVSGWKTTADFTGSDNTLRREIEFWRYGKGIDDNNYGVKPAEGKFYAELNAHTPAALYQNVCISDQDKMTWSLQHRVRVKEEYEKIKFFIADEIVDSGQSDKLTVKNPKYLKNHENSEIFSTPFRSGVEERDKTDGWKKHYSATEIELKEFLDGKTSAVKAFGFEAVDYSTKDPNKDKENGINPERGNWLDDIHVNLKPAIEFSAVSGEIIENKNDDEEEKSTIHAINFNIVGNVQGDISVNFVIDEADLPISKKAAIYRDKNSVIGDYQIIDIATGNAITVTKVNVEADTNKPARQVLKFKYNIKYDSKLNYDTGVTIKGLGVKIFDNEASDGERVIPFKLDEVQDQVIVMDLNTCGGPKPNSYFEYKIIDDDVDLEVTKKLVDTALRPGSKVSYEIELFNHSDNVAQNVVLYDKILSNLSISDSTKISCVALENEGNPSDCPTSLDDKEKVVNLFSNNGLNIGSVAGKARLKFTVSNLILGEKDTSSSDYFGLIANKINVVALDSTDVNLDNNEAIAKDLYPALSDLMNANESGKGLFKFANNESEPFIPLISQNIVDSQAYFPLKIRNDAKLEQDYQLYASKAKIEPTVEGQQYSSLKLEGIQNYTEELKVEFYNVSTNGCKPNMPSAQQITQIKVPANSDITICAKVTSLPSAEGKQYNIWFAIESIQTGLGDIILDAVTVSKETIRKLELVNDQRAQVNIGGTYVFLHRLFNHGTINESDIFIQLKPINDEDGFLYTLFRDINSDGKLGSGDQVITDKLSLNAGETLQLLVKVQAPVTANNGQMSQVEILVEPNNLNQEIQLVSLLNTDTVFVGSDQVQVTKMQFKNENCTNLDDKSIRALEYSLNVKSIGKNDCLIYRISVKNIGAEYLSKVEVSDMYPAYTTKWESNSNLPTMSEHSCKAQDNCGLTEEGKRIKAIFDLKPLEEKHLYFGIRLQ